MPALGRAYPQSWTDGRYDAAFGASQFGVSLLTPVDPYRMSQRSTKYQLLFIALTFLTLWLFEVLSGLRVHPVQYLLVGFSMCLFYLLMLALSEHLGFGVAYVLASSAVAGLITLYSATVLQRKRRALGLGGAVGGMYAYLYAVLSSENYALLSGALALFAVLALVMFLTRQTDWYSLGQQAAAQSDDLALQDPPDEAFSGRERDGSAT